MTNAARTLRHAPALYAVFVPSAFAADEGASEYTGGSIRASETTSPVNAGTLRGLMAETTLASVLIATHSRADEPGQDRFAQGCLDELVRLAAGRPVTVYVPGEDVLLTEVSLPGGRRAQLLRAVPYAVEDRLAEDIDDVHVALAAQPGDAMPGGSTRRWPVAVVARARLEAWLAHLKAAGLVIGSVVPDVLAVPWSAGAWRVWIDGERCLVRTGASGGFVTDRATLPVLLAATWRAGIEAVGEDADHASAPSPNGEARLPQRLYCLGSETDCTWLREQAMPAAGLSLPVEGDSAARDAGTPVASGTHPPTLDLLQGDYRPATDWSRRVRPWWPALALLIVWSVSVIAHQLYLHHRLSVENATLQADITGLFRQSFPQAKRIVNPRAQMQYRLGLLRAQVGHGTQGLATLLGRIAPVLVGSASSITLRTLRYEDGQMQLGLEADSLQTLDGLKQRLSALPGLSVTLESASARDGRAQGRLRIKEGGA